MAAGVSIYSIHDLALTISFDLGIGEEAHRIVMLLKKELEKGVTKEIVDIVPAYNSLSVYFSSKPALMLAMAGIKKIATEIATSPTTSTATSVETKTNTLVEIPVCYELPFAVDTPAILARLGMSQEEIIQRHSQKKYTVYMNGFIPGFSYMGTLDSRLELPRKKVPTGSVPAGSVAIAAQQTGIYPFESPGGWHIIGRTPIKMFEKNRSPACLLQPGDTVLFYPITVSELENWL